MNLISAIFADDKFISYTHGAFMQLVPIPKVYTYSDKQIEIIKNNFISKINKINNTPNLSEKDKQLTLIDNSENRDKKELSKYKDFELRFYTFNRMCVEDFIENIDFNKHIDSVKISK